MRIYVYTQIITVIRILNRKQRYIFQPCLPPVKTYTPTQIKRLRTRYKASQAVFAAFLNTSPSTVQKWEQGQKKPNGPSLKLLNLVDAHGLEALA